MYVFVWILFVKSMEERIQSEVFFTKVSSNAEIFNQAKAG